MKKANFGMAGLALATASALLRFWALAQTPFANGWDSYFYLVQVKSWLETGRMHSPEASLVYPLMRFFHWFTGDYMLMFKVCAAFLAGAFTAAAIWTGNVLGKNTTPVSPPEGLSEDPMLKSWPEVSPAILLGAWTVFSPHLTYFAAQFPKNLLGLTLFLGFVGTLHRADEAVFQKMPQGLAGGRWRAFFKFGLPSLGLLGLNYFGHRLTFGLALVYGALFLAFRWGGRVVFSKKVWLAAAVGLVVLVWAGRFFPGLFQMADFGRLVGWLGWPRFTPYIYVCDFGTGGRLSAWWLFEIWATVGLVFLGALGRILMPGKWAMGQGSALLALCLLLLWPFGEWSLTSFSYRFWMVFVLIAPFLAMFTPLADPRPQKGGTAGKMDLIDRQRLLYVVHPPPLGGGGRPTAKFVCQIFALVTLLFSACFSWESYAPAKHDPNYAFFQKLTDTALARLGPEKPELVIAHNALAEFFTFTTGTDAMPWLPEYDIAPEKLWRIGADVRMPELEYFLQKPAEGRLFRLPGNYVLLREREWRLILKNARAEGDADFLARAESWKNPFRLRPAFLLNRKKSGEAANDKR